MIYFFIGLPGAGKTTIGKAFYECQKKSQSHVVFLDGDAVREVFLNDLGYSIGDRKTNLLRLLKLCKFLDDQGIHVVCSVLSIFPEYLEDFRKNFSGSKVIYINVPIEEISKRDQKKLFSTESAIHVVGKDIEFRPPVFVDLELQNSMPYRDLQEIVNDIYSKFNIK